MRSMRILALLALLMCGLLSAGDAGLRIFWIDTEGGAATLIVTPQGESVLVDSGNPGGRDSKRIVECAKAAGLKQIDFLVTTHYHLDHFGGAAEVNAQLPIMAVYDNGIFEGGWEKPSQQYQLFPAGKRVVLNAGDVLPLKEAGTPAGVTLRCIGGRKQFIPPPPGATPAPLENPKRKAEDRSDNANSIVLLLSYGTFDMYLAGDLTWNIEEQLVNPVKLVPEVELYQVTHHGLDSSNNPLLVRALAPTVAVMTNGVKKGCGPETVATLRGTPSIKAIYQAHRSLRDDKDTVNTKPEWIANAEEKCEGHFIQCTVAPGGATYTLALPAHNHTQAFTSK